MAWSYRDIIPLYEKRWAEKPGSLYFLPLANAYRALGNPNKAIALLKQGLSLHPDHPSARACLALAYHEAGMTEEAQKEAQEVLARRPDNLLARRLLAECYRAAGRVEDALAELKQLLELAPQDERIAQALESLEQEVAKEAAEIEAEERPAQKEAPLTDLEPTEELAELYLSQGLLDDALAVYRALHAQDPTNERLQKQIEALEVQKAARPPDEPLEALVEDIQAVEEIQDLFSAEPEPPKETPEARVISTLEEWLKVLERRQKSHR
jgi:tetratricopeptide (TPR) repeat protein